MNEQQKSLPYSYEAGVVAAWREQLAQAAENPWLAGVLLEHGERILRRFVHFYQQLRALSRRAQRYIQRKLALGLGAAALLLALSSIQVPLAFADTITVDGTVCTLAAAINNANNDTAIGGCTQGNGPDTLDITNDITLTAALPPITSTITIEGNGHTIERDSGGATDFRILMVDGHGANNGDLTLKEATISGGDVSGWPGGGGVLNYYGTVSIENSTISGNTADDGGGVHNVWGTLTIENSTISSNSASYGGGVYNVYGTLTINNSTISGNSAYRGGGGVYSTALNGNMATLTINNSTISGNSAYRGGGVANFVDRSTATVIIENSTISGNSADGGGGVTNLGFRGTATVTIENSTISGNTADGGGGVHNSAFLGGTATVDLSHSIVSGNTATGAGNEVWNNDTVNADGYNLFGDSSETDAEAFHGFAPTVPTDINATINGTNTALGDILDDLADNGGPTETHALVPGSPAIDAGDPAFAPPPEFDQRGPGFPRVVNGVIDIGAYEVQPPPEPVGGVVVPVNKLELIVSWLGLAVLTVIGVVGRMLLLGVRKGKP